MTKVVKILDIRILRTHDNLKARGFLAPAIEPASALSTTFSPKLNEPGKDSLKESLNMAGRERFTGKTYKPVYEL